MSAMQRQTLEQRCMILTTQEPPLSPEDLLGATWGNSWVFSAWPDRPNPLYHQCFNIRCSPQLRPFYTTSDKEQTEAIIALLEHRTARS